MFETEKGIFPGVQFVFDLCLPDDFQPHVNDGEVSGFYCWPLHKVISRLIDGVYRDTEDIT